MVVCAFFSSYSNLYAYKMPTKIPTTTKTTRARMKKTHTPKRSSILLLLMLGDVEICAMWWPPKLLFFLLYVLYYQAEKFTCTKQSDNGSCQIALVPMSRRMQKSIYARTTNTYRCACVCACARAHLTFDLNEANSESAHKKKHTTNSSTEPNKTKRNIHIIWPAGEISYNI